MDSNSTRLCRLCLEISDDLVNIFEDFQDSTIASILTQHFWFQVYKNDGFSECLCQLCWTNTKTFHKFYKKVEQLQKNYWNSANFVEDDSCDADETVCVETNSTDDLIKEERCGSPRDEVTESDIYIVKYEETEQSEQVIDLQISKEESSDDNEIDNNCDQSESAQTSDDEQQPNNKKRKQSNSLTNNIKATKLLPTGTDSESKNEEFDDLDESQQNSDSQSIRCKKDTAKEDAQIREFFSMECEICRDRFETFVKAKNHYRIVHNTAGYLTCCGKKFLRRGRVLDHIHRHLNPDAYRCDPCGKRFADKFALKNHIENHEPFTSRAYKCNLCSSSFTKPSKLAQHERLRHCSEADKKFHCDKCNKNFVSKSVLASHIRGVHEFAFAHVCDICARVFKSKHVFQNHMQEHSTITRPKMQCNVCGAWLKHEESLRKHLKRHQDTFANCHICNKVLQNKHSLGNHIRSVHGERSHQCTMCDKAFKKAIVLKEHMALHTGQDLYKCPYCAKTFKSGANMHAHRKKAHFSEWTRDRSKRFTPTSVE